MTLIRVVDFETTGMEPPAVVIEVGYTDFLLESGNVTRPRSWLCGASEVPPEVRAIHHITLAMVARLAPFDRATLIAKAKADDVAAIAAHNIEFEMQWLPHELPFICTYKAALRVWPEAPSHSNGALRYWLEDQQLIELDAKLTMPSHRAGPDTYVTAHILKALFATGATGKEMIAWSKEYRMLPRCSIGEWKGKPWAEVDVGFLRWMVGKDGMEPDLRWLARRELDRRNPPRPLPPMG